MTSGRGFSEDMRLAHVLADQADSISLERFRAQDLKVDTKPDLTPVTDADRAVEESIRRTLSRVRSRDWVSESASSARTWASLRSSVKEVGMGHRVCPWAREPGRRAAGY